MSRGPDTAKYNELVAFTKQVVEIAQRRSENGSVGFVSERKPNGYHILFAEFEVSIYFDKIRESLLKETAGKCLKDALANGAITAESSNKELWSALVNSLQFNGVDFEHGFGILPAAGAEGKPEDVWSYAFEESIVLGHTLVLCPVMQHYGPLTPKLDLKSPTSKFEQAQPLLAVGMIGDCVKGKFFDQIKQLAESGDAPENNLAEMQRNILLNPARLQQKMSGLVRALVLACRESGAAGLVVDAVLVGSGAFGGSAAKLAQPFADSLNGGDIPFDDSKDEINFFMFPPPKPEEFTLEPLKYKNSLNSKKGLGAASEGIDNVIRVLVAGFDPISIAPHGVLNRALSAEGQLCHATDFLSRVTGTKGAFMNVQVPKGDAWESPQAFFAKPQEPKYKQEEGYDTVRYVPLCVLEALGVKEEQEADVRLVATERVPPRMWNGDSCDGWTLSLEDVDGKRVIGKTWRETLAVPG